MKLILDGELVKATVAQQPYEMGYQVVEAAVKAVKGESVDEVINAPVQVVPLRTARLTWTTWRP